MSPTKATKASGNCVPVRRQRPAGIVFQSGEKTAGIVFQSEEKTWGELQHPAKMTLLCRSDPDSGHPSIGLSS